MKVLQPSTWTPYTRPFSLNLKSEPPFGVLYGPGYPKLKFGMCCRVVRGLGPTHRRCRAEGWCKLILAPKEMSICFWTRASCQSLAVPSSPYHYMNYQIKLIRINSQACLLESSTNMRTLKQMTYLVLRLIPVQAKLLNTIPDI